MKILEALNPVFINGRIVDSGNRFSCSDEFAEKLIESKSARLFEEEKDQNPEQSQVDSNSDQDQNPEQSQEGQKELESLTKEKLLELAVEEGIEGLSDRDKKDDIIKAILSNRGE